MDGRTCQGDAGGVARPTPVRLLLDTRSLTHDPSHMPEEPLPESRPKLKKLLQVLGEDKAVLIVLQDYPDPDAIAAAAALKDLTRNLKNACCSIACAGPVGRSENRALVRYLGLNLLVMAGQDLGAYDRIVLVDTQPGTGNNSLPRDSVPDIVIDHHPIRRQTRRSAFHDIRRRYGATSTILFEYLAEAGIAPSIPLATALLYGIRSDTNDLGRETTQADINAIVALYSTANKRMLGRIVMERLPREYFTLLGRALTNARTYGRCLTTALGNIDNPDMLGEVADLLLRDEESTWALAYGIHDGRMLLSLRTAEPEASAGQAMHRLVGRKGTGGGHNAMAGGQIPLKKGTAREIVAIEGKIIERLLRLAGEPQVRARRLIPA